MQEVSSTTSRVLAVYMSATEIKRSWGTMIKYLKSGHPILVLKHGQHVVTIEPQKQYRFPHC